MAIEVDRDLYKSVQRYTCQTTNQRNETMDYIDFIKNDINFHYKNRHSHFVLWNDDVILRILCSLQRA